MMIFLFPFNSISYLKPWYKYLVKWVGVHFKIRELYKNINERNDNRSQLNYNFSLLDVSCIFVSTFICGFYFLSIHRTNICSDILNEPWFWTKGSSYIMLLNRESVVVIWNNLERASYGSHVREFYYPCRVVIIPATVSYFRSRYFEMKKRNVFVLCLRKHLDVIVTKMLNCS
jgi:hypothetical protein